MNTNNKVAYMAQLSLLIAIMVFMAFTPFGYIPLGFMNATTMHIPVIIGAIILGPKAGAILGGLFGITSVIKATITPVVTSFVFSPFYSVGEFSGNWTSLIVAIVPRVLIGVASGYTYLALRKTVKSQSLCLGIAGFVGSMVNTIGVMGLIYIFFGQDYSLATGASYEALFGIIMGVVGMSGVPEAILAAVITTAVCKALIVYMGKSKKMTKSKVQNI